MRIAPSGRSHKADSVPVERLTRLGCLELKLGRRRISNGRHDATWDKALYEAR